MSVFDTPGLLLRRPDSGIEGLADDWAAAGFKWISPCFHEAPPGEWAQIIAEARAAGLRVAPWAYIFSGDSLSDLVADCRGIAADGMLPDVEKEFDNGVYSVEQVDAACREWGGDVALTGEPTPYWNVDWSLLAAYRYLIQIYPGENDSSKDPRGCRMQWFQRAGMRRAVFMFGGKNGMEPELYNRAGAFSVYAAEDIPSTGRTVADWGPRELLPLDLPYTGPLRWTGTPFTSSTAKALKIAMNNAGFADFRTPDLYYNRRLHDALTRLWWSLGREGEIKGYGRVLYEALRTLCAANRFEHALTPTARALIEADADD